MVGPAKGRVIPAQAAKPGLLEQFFGGGDFFGGGGGLQMGGGGPLQQSSFNSPFGPTGSLSGAGPGDQAAGGYFPDTPQLGGIFPGAWDLSGMLGMPAQPQRTIFDQAANVAAGPKMNDQQLKNLMTLLMKNPAPPRGYSPEKRQSSGR